MLLGSSLYHSAGFACNECIRAQYSAPLVQATIPIVNARAPSEMENTKSFA
jgi:hypothetical protein